MINNVVECSSPSDRDLKARPLYVNTRTEIVFDIYDSLPIFAYTRSICKIIVFYYTCLGEVCDVGIGIKVEDFSFISETTRVVPKFLTELIYYVGSDSYICVDIIRFFY